MSLAAVSPSASLLPKLLVVLAGGALLFALMKGLGWLLALLPMARGRRDTLSRVTPVLAGLTALAYLLLTARYLLGASPAFEPLALGAILLFALAAAWPALRGATAGVFIKAGRVCKVGDVVRVDGHEGTVRRMGLVSLVIETAQGDEAIIPYTRISAETLLRTAARDRFAHHTFIVRAPAAMLTSLARARIREAALRSHWAAINREPEIKHTAGNVFEVTVFALHPDRVLDIERAVLAALGDEDERTPRKRTARVG